MSLLLLPMLVPVASALANSATCLGAATTIDGTTADDVIYGTPGPDVAAGFAGNDVIYGRAGDDRLCGGRAGDVVLDGVGADFVDGGEGLDVLYLCPDGALDRWRSVERVVRSTRACT